MKNKYSKILKLVTLAGALPFVYGCGSGGGTGALLGLLFGGTGIGGGTIALLGGTVADTALTSGATELAVLHQPEPASMLLLSGGLAAMAYIRSKTNARSK